VEDRPAAEILTQLASLFRYAWRKDGEAYVLYVPDETRQQEESVLRAGREARGQALRDVIHFLATRRTCGCADAGGETQGTGEAK
jgi:hypothetical protein